MKSYKTTDTGELAPYPNMTSDDLHDFEAWCREQDESAKETFKIFGMISAIILLFLILALFE